MDDKSVKLSGSFKGNTAPKSFNKNPIKGTKFTIAISSAKGGEQYGPRFNFRGFPKICRNAPKALNQTSRKKLWEISEKLIKSI